MPDDPKMVEHTWPTVAMDGVQVAACTGGYTCWAVVHEHGCYSDHGDCTAPEEHVHA